MHATRSRCDCPPEPRVDPRSDRLPPPPSQPDEVLVQVWGKTDRTTEYGDDDRANHPDDLQNSHRPTVAGARGGGEARTRLGGDEAR